MWKTEAQKVRDLDPLRKQFMDQYLVGSGLDVGGRGATKNDVPIVPGAVIVDLNYPGYDGRTLPFPDASQDFVFSSHTLEHIEDELGALKEWWRALKPGGALFITVPHAYLYERKYRVAHQDIEWHAKSRWNGDHRRAYTSAALARSIELALEPNTYRIRSLRDVDAGYNYQLPKTVHADGCYELEAIVEKLPEPPLWLVD